MGFSTMLFLAVGGFFAFKAMKELQRQQLQQQMMMLKGGLPAERPSPADAAALSQEPVPLHHGTLIDVNSYPPPPAAPDTKGGGIKKFLVIGLCVLYIVSPHDFIPDIFPVVGWGDDLGAAVIGLRAMLSK